MSVCIRQSQKKDREIERIKFSSLLQGQYLSGNSIHQVAITRCCDWPQSYYSIGVQVAYEREREGGNYQALLMKA